MKKYNRYNKHNTGEKVLKLILSVFTAVFCFPIALLFGPIGFLIIVIIIFIAYHGIYDWYSVIFLISKR